MKRALIVLAQDAKGSLSVLSCVPDDDASTHVNAIEAASKDERYEEVAEVKFPAVGFVYRPAAYKRDREREIAAEAEAEAKRVEAERKAMLDRKVVLESELEQINKELEEDDSEPEKDAPPKRRSK